MEVALELEDDLFFADLSKQISLLIMDEDEDPLACCRPENLQTFSGAIHPPPHPTAFIYEQTLLTRQSKGTGVFIPQSTQPRRRYRKGKSSSYAKHQRQSQDTRMVAQEPMTNPLKPRNG